MSNGDTCGDIYKIEVYYCNSFKTMMTKPHTPINLIQRSISLSNGVLRPRLVCYPNKCKCGEYLEFHANVFDKEHGKLRHWIPHLLSSPIKPWCFSQKAFTTNRLFIEKQVDVNNWIYEYNLK